MPKLNALKPSIQTLRTSLRSSASGDERIRGWALTKIRERILSRDKGICQCARCKLHGHLKSASIVDHTVPLWAGGLEHDSNRQSINTECHDAKSLHEAACRSRGEYVQWTGANGG